MQDTARHLAALGPPLSSQPCVAPVLPAGADPLPPELEGQLDWEVLRAPFFIEAAVVLPQHSALLLADTGFCMAASEYAHLGQGNIDAAKKVGVWDRLGPITRVVFDKYPKVSVVGVETSQVKRWAG